MDPAEPSASSTSKRGLSPQMESYTPSRSQSQSQSQSRTRQKRRRASTPMSLSCCSDAGLVCCDAPGCSDIDIDDEEKPDCAECAQGVEIEQCTEDCFKTPSLPGKIPVAACEECSIVEQQQQQQQPACSDPACEGGDKPTDAETLLEWDDASVDELLRCCCNGTEHHHASFATGAGISGSHLHHHTTTYSSSLAVPSTAIPPSQAGSEGQTKYLAPSPVFNYHLPLHPHSHHTHAGARANEQFPPPLAVNADRSDLSTPSTSTATYTFSSPALSSASASTGQLASSCADQLLPSTHARHQSQSQSQPIPFAHSHAHADSFALPSAAVPLLPSESRATTQEEVFCCQWLGCSASFGKREELVGHVNVVHLLHVKPSSPTPGRGPPGALADHSEMGPPQHLAMHTSSSSQDQLNDESFEHTMRCLWDSCGVPLPPVPQPHSQTFGDPSSMVTGSESESGGVPASSAVEATTGMPPVASSSSDLAAASSSLCAGHNHTHTPDAYTASLVKHLLQDHLHLAPELLMQLSPSIEQSLHFAPSLAPAPVHSQRSTPHPQEGSVPPSPAFSTTANSVAALPHIDFALPTQNYESYSAAGSARQTVQAHTQWSLPGLDPTGLASGPPLTQQVDMPAAALQFQDPSSTDEKPCAATRRPAGISARASASASVEEPQAHACQWTGCSEVFDSTSALMEHVSSCHVGSGQSFYSCGWAGCPRAASGRSFNQRQKVIRHVRTHVGDKPFLCPEPGCGRAFSESTTLQQHLRTHTLEKPFACTEPGCGKRFAIQSALTIHMRTHSGEKPFKCPVQGCGMAFAESSNLSKHVKAHRAAEGKLLAGAGRAPTSRKRKQESVDLDEDYHASTCSLSAGKVIKV